jgi:outer membrane receptor protein involved in Fe transport
MHGAINVIQAAPAELPRQSLSLEGGPDEFYRGRLTLSRPGEATDLGGALVATHDGGWRDHSGLDEQKLNLSLLRHAQNDATLGVQFAATNLSQETAGFIQGFESYKDESIAKSNANPEAYRDAYAMRLTGDYKRPLGNAQLSIRPFVRHSRMDFLQHFLIGKPLEENGQDSLGVATALQTVVFADMQLLAGIDLELADGFLKETQAGPATDGAPTANAIRPAGKHYDYDVQSEVAALYGQIEQPFAERFKLTAGARLEYVNYNYDNKMLAGNTRDDGTTCGAAGCLYARPADRSDNFTNFTSKLGLSYALTEEHVLYVTGTRGMRAPDTSELYRLQRQQSIAELAKAARQRQVGARRIPARCATSPAEDREGNVSSATLPAFGVSDGGTVREGVEYVQWLP